MGSDIWPVGSVMVGGLVLAMIYGYLYLQYHYRYLVFWALAWLVYIIPAFIDTMIAPVPEVVLNGFSMLASYFLARGMLAFLGIYFSNAERHKRLLLYGVLVAIGWMIFAYFIHLSADWQIAISYLYLFATLGAMGAFMLFNWRKSVAFVVLGLPLLLLGICAYLAILVLPKSLEVVLLFVLGICLLVLAIAMLIAFVEHLRRDILESQQRARREIEESLAQAQTDYRNVVEQQAVGVAIVDEHEVFRYANPAAEAIMGVPAGGLDGRSLRDFASDEQFRLLVNQTAVHQSGQSSSYDLIIHRPDGEERLIQVYATPRLGRDGKFSNTLGVFQDITARRRAESEVQRLLEQERFYRHQAEILQMATGDLVSALDVNTVLEHVMTNLQTVVPYDSTCLFLYNEKKDRLTAVASRGFVRPEKVAGLELSKNQLVSIVEDTRRPLILQDAQTDQRYDRVGDAEHVHGWMGLPLIWHDEMIGLLTIDNRRVGAYSEADASLAEAFANQAAIAIQNSRLFERLERMAVTDPLTGLYNRRHLFEEAQHEFARHQRYGTSLTVVMMDIDHFNAVNNTYGHLTGDAVLRQVADRLRLCIRMVDLIGRYGGEEFMVVLTDLDMQAAREVAERLRRSVADEPIPYGEHQVRVTLSIGVAAATPDCAGLDTVINRADQALYRAKDSGRNCVAVWQPPEG